MDKSKQYCYRFRRNLCRKIYLFIIFFTQSAAPEIFHRLPRSCTSASLPSAAPSKNWKSNLDTTLFKRSSRGVTLTPDGQILYEKVKGAFDLLSEGEDSILHNRSREIPRLRIGASTTLCKYVLMPRLKDFIAANPQIRITYFLPVHLPDSETSGRRQNRHWSDRTTAEAYPDTNFCLCCRSRIPLSLHKQYLENQHQLFPSEPLHHTATFMLLDEQNITRQSVNTMLHEHQLQLGHILEVSSMDLLIQFAQVGLGNCLCDQRICAK